MQLTIADDWMHFLHSLFERNSFKQTTEQLTEYLESDKEYYPADNLLFEAFNKCRLTNLKVVILGQDPYHGEQQANGLCFSVNKGTAMPPSLKNIFKELENDLGISLPATGNLSKWSEEGVLLLNSVLTVFPNQPRSHKHLNWQAFTDEVIELISEELENVVFILWGSFAHKKTFLIDAKKHLILKSVHPSPLSAFRGFFGNGHFSKANAYLVEHKKQPVDWCLD